MILLKFNLDDYKKEIRDRFAPPNLLCPYLKIDPLLYNKYAKQKRRGNDIGRAFTELKKRTGDAYFYETYPIQSQTLDYSARSFPAYRFILPEVMTEDWLGIVDWGKFQRDHVLHQPLAGYIILKLLDENPINVEERVMVNGNTLLKECVNKILSWQETAYIKDFLLNLGMREDDPLLDFNSVVAQNVWKALFIETAYLAAVFHDLGYPWQYLQGVRDNLDGINAPEIEQNQDIEQVIEKFGQRLFFQALNGYKTPDKASPSTWRDKIINLTSQAMSSTHGLSGALGFLHLNDSIRKYPSYNESPMHLLCVEWAATAIMMHDMKKIYWGKAKETEIPENPFLRLSFDTDPLSAIVTLADVLQEFERPTVDFNEYLDGALFKYNAACSETRVQIDNDGTMKINYKMKNNQMRALKRNSILDDTYKYFDTQYGYINMSSLGINKVQMIAT